MCDVSEAMRKGNTPGLCASVVMWYHMFIRANNDALVGVVGEENGRGEDN